MYINYEEIAQKLTHICPIKLHNHLISLGQTLKVIQNVNYIKKNQKKVLKNLRKKVKKEKLVVAFYVYDNTKWKCQTIYDLLEKSEHFIPYIHATKNIAKIGSSYQPSELVHTTFNFFKNKGMRVLYNYDVENNKPIPTQNMNPKPDIIFYQHPWYIATEQGPVKTSEFALTYYVPYFLATSVSPIEYYLRFHQYVQTHYVLNNQIKNYFSKNMSNKGKNLKVVGHPQLDYFYINKHKEYENKRYVIYAPHWTIDNQTELKWGTFLWSGEYMLEFAKQHREFNWVFKPHPNLMQLLKMRHWSEEKIQNYWGEWKEIGTVCEQGDYLDMFMESKMLITDCGSFQTEYFMTQKPCIYLKSETGVPFNPSVQSIVDTYYSVKNKEELEKTLETVLIKGQDTKQKERQNVFNELGYNDNYTAQNIIKDLLKTLQIEE